MVGERSVGESSCRFSHVRGLHPAGQSPFAQHPADTEDARRKHAPHPDDPGVSGEGADQRVRPVPAGPPQKPRILGFDGRRQPEHPGHPAASPSAAGQLAAEPGRAGRRRQRPRGRRRRRAGLPAAVPALQGLAERDRAQLPEADGGPPAVRAEGLPAGPVPGAVPERDRRVSVPGPGRVRQPESAAVRPAGAPAAGLPGRRQLRAADNDRPEQQLSERRTPGGRLPAAAAAAVVRATRARRPDAGEPDAVRGGEGGRLADLLPGGGLPGSADGLRLRDPRRRRLGARRLRRGRAELVSAAAVLGRPALRVPAGGGVAAEPLAAADVRLLEPDARLGRLRAAVGAVPDLLVPEPPERGHPAVRGLRHAAGPVLPAPRAAGGLPDCRPAAVLEPVVAAGQPRPVGLPVSGLAGAEQPDRDGSAGLRPSSPAVLPPSERRVSPPRLRIPSAAGLSALAVRQRVLSVLSAAGPAASPPGSVRRLQLPTVGPSVMSHRRFASGMTHF